jgi:hypothetical protein
MFALFAGLPHTRAATTERIVVDRHTGLDDESLFPHRLLLCWNRCETLAVGVVVRQGGQDVQRVDVLT